MDISFALESTMSPKIKNPSSTVVHKKSKAPGKLALRRKIRRSSYLDRFPRKSFLADEKKTPISVEGWNSDDDVALNESFSDLSIITGDYQKKSGIGAINSTFVNTNNNIRFDELFKNNDKQNLIKKNDEKHKVTEKGKILGNIPETTEITSSNDSDCSVIESSLMSNHEEQCLIKVEPATPVRQLEEAKEVLVENYGNSWRKNEADILRTEPRPRLSTKINRIHKAVCQTDVKKTKSNSYKGRLLNNKNNNNKLRFSLSDNENDSSVINHISNIPIQNTPLEKHVIKKESYNHITPKTEIRNSNLSDIIQIYNSDSDEEDLNVVESLTETHLNPYLNHERNKSIQVLRAVQSERVNRKINSTLLQNLKKLCDSESSDDYSPIAEKEKTKTFVRTEWVNRKSNSLSKQVDVTNDTNSSNESDVARKKVPVRLEFEESDSEDDVFVKEPPRKSNLVKKNLTRKKSVSFSKDSDIVESSDSDNVVIRKNITPFKSNSSTNCGNTRDIDLKKQSDSKRSNIKSKLVLLKKDTPKNRHESKKSASSDSNNLIDSSDSEGIITQNNYSKTPPKQIASNLFTKDGTPRNVTMRKRGSSIKFATNDCNLIESSGSDSNRPKSISRNNNSNQPSNDLDDELDSLQSFALKLSLNTPDSQTALELAVNQANTIKVSSAENKSDDIPKTDDKNVDKSETAKKSRINSLKSSSNNEVRKTPSKKELQDIKKTLDEVYGPSWRLNEAEILGDLDESIAINNQLNETDIGKSSPNFNKKKIDCNPVSQPVKSKLNFNTPGKLSTKSKDSTNTNSDLKKVSGKNKFSFSDEATSRYFENNTPRKDKTGSTKVLPEYNKKPINNTPLKIRTKIPAKTNNELFLNPNDLRKFQAITPNNKFSGINGISGKFERKAATDIKAKIKPAFSGGLGSEIPTLSKKLMEPVKGRSITNDFTKCFYSNVPLKTIVKPTKSFLESLSKHVPTAECDQTARIFRTNYSANRAELTNRLFKLFNERVFAGCMSSNTPVEWSERLTKTGGFCRCKRVKRSTGKLERTVAITLSAKVLDTPDRLRDTLIHEMCHGANFIIDGEGGHGPSWKAWANKAMTIFPELPEIKRCHSYSIDTKYTYRCLDCGYSFGRHSKSLEMDRKRCGHCFGKFELLVNKKTKDGSAKSVPATPKREPTGFALYVKDNYSKVETPQLKHGDVMKQLGQNFSAMKVGKKLVL